jgi:hypothetical protein
MLACLHEDFTDLPGDLRVAFAVLIAALVTGWWLHARLAAARHNVLRLYMMLAAPAALIGMAREYDGEMLHAQVVRRVVVPVVVFVASLYGECLLAGLRRARGVCHRARALRRDGNSERRR